MKALFVTLDKCPNIDAGAVRTHMIAKMLVDNHFDVTVISMGPYNNRNQNRRNSGAYYGYKEDNLPKARTPYNFVTIRT